VKRRPNTTMPWYNRSWRGRPRSCKPSHNCKIKR
jgi:hypothetical protein